MSLAEYFAKNRYKPKYHIGDRVKGHINSVPFCGTVYNDTQISEESEPIVFIHSDLPIDAKHLIQVKHRDIQPLK